jgi:hypothetical protein
LVVSAGPALPTVETSLGSLQELDTEMLFPSPEYLATHLKLPALVGVNVGELYELLPETAAVSVEGCAFSGVVQVESLEAYTFQVIDPVGLAPPDKVAVSEIGDPRAAAECAWVVRLGVTLVTVEISLASEHEVAGGAVFALSPE